MLMTDLPITCYKQHTPSHSNPFNTFNTKKTLPVDIPLHHLTFSAIDINVYISINNKLLEKRLLSIIIVQTKYHKYSLHSSKHLVKSILSRA